MDIAILKNTASVEIASQLLNQLKTPTMATSFVELATNPIHQNLTLVESVMIMASKELESRAEKRRERYLQRSGLRDLSVWNQADITKAIYEKERNGICQASFPEISQKNRYQLSSSRDVVPDPRIFVYQSRSIDRPRNVLSCSHGTGRDPDDRYHSRSPRIRAGRSFLIHLLLFNRFRWLLRI